jgi:hypothetical protein
MSPHLRLIPRTLRASLPRRIPGPTLQFEGCKESRNCFGGQGLAERDLAFVLFCCLSVLQHGPRVSLGCRSNEFLDHAKNGLSLFCFAHFSPVTPWP